jgi:hypothetical protein
VSPSWDPVQIEREEYERADEPMGTKEKFWVRLPDDDRLWLFKLARESNELVRGEDWAEWIVHQLATLIGVPSAEIHPALWDEQRGIISRSMLSGLTEELVHGNSVLFGHNPRYDQQALRENPGYTPAAVRDALTGVSSPASAPELAAFSGYDVWAGYLLLDAWTAGRDRHHQNWALIRVGTERRLAPSFDHGNALGFAETDEARQRLLDDESKFARWLARGKSHHFAGRPSLVDLAIEALGLATPEAAEYWIERLNAVDEHAVKDVVEAVPENVMSALASRFVVRLLGANRRRVLDGYRASQSG